MRHVVILIWFALSVASSCAVGDIPEEGPCVLNKSPACVPSSTEHLDMVIDTDTQFGGTVKSSFFAESKPLGGTFLHADADSKYALVYAMLSAPRINLLGVLTNAVGGSNTNAQIAEVQRVATLAGMPGLRIVGGVVGVYTDLKALLGQPYQGSEAVNFLISEAHKARNAPLAVVMTGKATNLALALAADPSIAHLIRVYWFAADIGLDDPAGVDGTYNIINDVDAANAVLGLNTALTILPSHGGIGRVVIRANTHVLVNTNSFICGGFRIDKGVQFPDGETYYTVGDYLLSRSQSVVGRSLGAGGAPILALHPEWAMTHFFAGPVANASGQIVEDPSSSVRVPYWSAFAQDMILDNFVSIFASPAVPCDQTSSG